MKLSIIIPVYNEVKYIRRCLDSVYANEDVEVIVVDDGSNDGTSEILEEYKDRFTIKRKTKTNFGVSWTRNVGLLEAEGDYVTFLDSDDEMSKGGIEKLLFAIDRGLEEGHNIIQFNHWRANGEEKSTKFYNHPGLYTLNKLPQKWVLCWNKLYRRDFLTAHDIKFPWNVTFEEDCIFNLRCFRYTQTIVHYGESIVIKHNDNKMSICHTVGRSNIIDISEALTELLKEGQPPELENIIRQRLSDTWNCKNAKRLFGGTP